MDNISGAPPSTPPSGPSANQNDPNVAQVMINNQWVSLKRDELKKQLKKGDYKELMKKMGLGNDDSLGDDLEDTVFNAFKKLGEQQRKKKTVR